MYYYMSCIMNSFFFISLILFSNMINKIQIESYPNLGICHNHLHDITMVCKQRSCLNNFAFCHHCVHPHKLYKSEEYIREIAKAIINIQPQQPAISRVFEELGNISEEIQIQLKQTIDILRGVNLNKYKIYRYLLNSSEEQVYEQLCQLNLKQNRYQFQLALSNLQKLKIKDKMAPQILNDWIAKVKRQTSQFIQTAGIFCDSFLNLDEKFSFNQVIQSLNQKPLEKPPSSLSVPELVLDLRQQNLVSESLVDRIKNSDFQKITHILVSGNSLVSQGLKSLLEDESIRFTNLKKLDLSNNYLQDECLDILIASEGMPRLEELNLQNNFIYSSQQTNIKIKMLQDKRRGLVIRI